MFKLKSFKKQILTTHGTLNAAYDRNHFLNIECLYALQT